MDLVVANISSDMAYDGAYFNRDGTEVEKGRYKPAPGEVYALSADRLARLKNTFDLGYAVHADTPANVREVVREANRLGIVIDMAHANNETLMDVLGLSSDPIIFSHGGVREFTDHDRAVTDDQIRAIAKGGGVVGIWPHGRHISTVAEMVDYMEHVIRIGGIDHVGIGSDLRGISRYVKGFDEQANFHAKAIELLERGYSDEAVGKVMGGNFFRVWVEVSES